MVIGLSVCEIIAKLAFIILDVIAEIDLFVPFEFVPLVIEHPQITGFEPTNLGQIVLDVCIIVVGVIVR